LARFLVQYHLAMGRWEKMRRNPQDWRIEDLEVVANRLDITLHKSGGSHVVFKHNAATMAVTVPAHRPIKPVYVQQFIKIVNELTGDNDE